MKYNLVDTETYKAVQIVFPNGVKVYVNNLHPSFDTIREVLEDDKVDNNDIAYMVLILNCVNYPVDIEELETAVTVQKAFDAQLDQSRVLEPVNASRSLPIDLPVGKEELVKVVSMLSRTGDGLSFDYIVQTDFDDEKNFPHISQTVFPITVEGDTLLAFDSEGNAHTYQVEGMRNLFYLGMTGESLPTVPPVVKKKKFSWFGLRKV